MGLAGEVRRVSGIRRRLSEAARLGVTTAIVPKESGPYPDGLRVHEVDTLRAALAVVENGR